MKIEEQVLSIEQMKHLQELGIDTSDASMCWVRAKRIIGKQRNNVSDNEMGKWSLSLSKSIVHSADWAVESVPTYTIGDLIEKLPKHFYIKEASIFMGALNGSGAFEVWYDKAPKSHKMDGNIKNALYKLLCWVAQKHKELLEVRND